MATNNTIIQLGAPVFSSDSSSVRVIGFNDTYAGINYPSAGQITLTNSYYDTVAKRLTVEATYKYLNYASQGVYMSINNDRTSLGSNSYTSFNNSTGGKNVGIGECYQIRTADSVTSIISSTNKTNISYLTKEGGKSYSTGVHNVTLTVSVDVDDSVISSGEITVFFRVMYSSAWKGINSPRWLGDKTWVRDISSKLTFKTAIKKYTIDYNNEGGTKPSSQTKYHDVNITLHGEQTRNPVLGTNGVTVTFDGNGGTPGQTSLISKKDVYYTFQNWKSQNDGTVYSSGATYSNNRNDCMDAIYSHQETYYPITLPSATHADDIWQRIVKYNVNGGNGSISNGVSQSIVTYEFDGWYTSLGSGVKGMNAGAGYTPDKSRTLYAHWIGYVGEYSSITLPSVDKSSTTDTRTIMLEPNGGSFNSELDRYVTSRAERSYTLKGWYTASTGGILRGVAGATYEPIYDEETLYAQYNSSVGTFSKEVLPIPTKTNYTFMGWSTDPNAKVGNVSSPYRPSDNITLYATWEEDQARAYVKDASGNWRKGKAFVQDERGAWRKAKKIYVKTADGSWRLNKNY